MSRRAKLFRDESLSNLSVFSLGSPTLDELLYSGRPEVMGDTAYTILLVGVCPSAKRNDGAPKLGSTSARSKKENQILNYSYIRSIEFTNLRSTVLWTLLHGASFCQG